MTGVQTCALPICANQHTDQTFGKKLLNYVPVLSQHASVMDAEAVRKQFTELLVLRFHNLKEQILSIPQNGKHRFQK